MVLSTQEILRRAYVPSQHALRAEGSSEAFDYRELSSQEILNDVFDEETNSFRFV